MNIDINVPDGKKGKWEIRTFTVSQTEAMVYNASVSGESNRFIHPGTYKQLLCFEGFYELIGYPVMSNTPAEVDDHMPFILKARGRVLVLGLGLGMVVQGLIDKEEVHEIHVVEIDADVISLAGEYYKTLSNKVSVIQADAYAYRSSNKYYAVWCDIWDAIQSDNLAQMAFFHGLWGGKSTTVMCWAEERCATLLAEEQEYNKQF